MSNTLIVPSIVARTALIVLENELVMAGLVHRDYSKEFQKVGSTVTIRQPASFTATAVAAASTIAVQNVTESSVQVILDTLLDVSVEITSAQMSLDIVDFSQQVLQPMMRAHAQAIDSKLTALHSDISSHYPVTSTPVVSDITYLREQLNLRKCPMDQRRLVFGPTTEARYLPLDAFLHAEKRGDTRAIKEASMGRVLGFDCYMDQNIEYESESVADAAGAAKGAIAAAATAATIDTLTDTEVINDNCLFKFTGQRQGYRITNGPLTVASTAITVTFSPALAVAVADDCVVTFQKTSWRNMAFHKNCFALVTAPLAPPLGGARGEVMTYKDLACRAVFDYNSTSKVNQLSIDMLCGAKTLDQNLGAILVDAQ